MRRAAEAERESLTAELDERRCAGRARRRRAASTPSRRRWPTPRRPRPRPPPALSAARAALGERRAACGRLELELETVDGAARARAESAGAVVELERERLAAEAAATDAALAALADDERAARRRARRRGGRAGRRRGGRRRRPATRRRAPPPRLAEATSAWRQVTAERAGVEADLEHAGASLAELREVDADVLRVAERYPGVVELSAAVSCERGYELALGAALAQHPGTLAVRGRRRPVVAPRGAALRRACAWSGCSRRRARARRAGDGLPGRAAARRQGDDRRRRPSRRRCWPTSSWSTT